MKTKLFLLAIAVLLTLSFTVNSTGQKQKKVKVVATKVAPVRPQANHGLTMEDPGQYN